MTRDDAKKIMENLAIISHYAAGGDIEHPPRPSFARRFAIGTRHELQTRSTPFPMSCTTMRIAWVHSDFVPASMII